MAYFVDDGDNQASDNDNASILSTARTTTGRTVAPSAVGESDIVTIDGVEMTAQQAEARGLLHRDASGRYLEPSADEQREALAKFNTPSEPQPFEESFKLKLAPDASVKLNDILDLSSQYGASPVQTLAEILSRPDQLPTGLAMAAQEQGLYSEPMLDDVRKVAADVATGIDDYLMREGVDPQTFRSWVSREAEHEYRNALISALGIGDGAALQAVVQRYLRATNRGFGVRNDGAATSDPSPLVDLGNGVQTTAAVAHRLGLL